MQTVNRIKVILLPSSAQAMEGRPGFSKQDLISIALDAGRNSQPSGVRRAS